MLENLKGIQKEREVKVRGKNSLEYLIEIGDWFIEEYAPLRPRESPIKDSYLEIYTMLKKLLEHVRYDQKDLETFILTKAGNYDYGDEEGKILGLYTGCLLSLLIERNKKKGEGTRFYINGRGNRFDYLLYCAKEIDELIIENFVGNGICKGIETDEGKNNLIVGKNIIGKNNFCNIGKGQISLIIGEAFKGDNSFSYIGNGYTLKEEHNGCRSGRCGHIGMVIGKKIKGNNAFQNIGGYINLILGKDIKGENILSNLGENYWEKIGLIVGENIKDNGEDTLSNCSVGKILFKNVQKTRESFHKITSWEKEPKEYELIISKYGINKILALIDNLGSGEDLIKQSQQIYQIYQSIEGKLKC